MRALSLDQPYATAIARLLKLVETRGWSTEIRGRFALCATRKPVSFRNPTLALAVVVADMRRANTPCSTCVHPASSHASPWPGCDVCECREWGPLVPLGAVVATAELVDVVPTEEVALVDDEGRWGWTRGDAGVRVDSLQVNLGDFGKGRFAWLLADVRPLADPIEVKGRQRWWNLPDDVAEAVVAAEAA